MITIVVGYYLNDQLIVLVTIVISKHFWSSTMLFSCLLLPPPQQVGVCQGIMCSSHDAMNYTLCFVSNRLPHWTISALEGGDVVPVRVLWLIIHASHCLWTWSLNGFFTLMLTGWHSKGVQPPGMCSTSTPKSWIFVLTDAIMWHR